MILLCAALMWLTFVAVTGLYTRYGVCSQLTIFLFLLPGCTHMTTVVHTYTSTVHTWTVVWNDETNVNSIRPCGVLAYFDFTTLVYFGIGGSLWAVWALFSAILSHHVAAKYSGDYLDDCSLDCGDVSVPSQLSRRWGNGEYFNDNGRQLSAGLLAGRAVSKQSD